MATAGRREVVAACAIVDRSGGNHGLARAVPLAAADALPTYQPESCPALPAGGADREARLAHSEVPRIAQADASPTTGPSSPAGSARRASGRCRRCSRMRSRRSTRVRSPSSAPAAPTPACTRPGRSRAFAAERDSARRAAARAQRNAARGRARAVRRRGAPGFNARFDARTQDLSLRDLERRGDASLAAPLRVARAAADGSRRDGRRRAALVGEHDFAAFQAAGSDVRTTCAASCPRRCVEVDVTNLVRPAAGGRLLRYEVIGTGFLRHMVRNIAGTLVDIGRGRRARRRCAAILASRDRARASATAPPHGLVLWQVDY